MRLVTDGDELRRLILAWRELLEASAAPNPMCAPAWLMTWWEVYGRDRRLAVGLFHDNARLIGLAPLCRRRHWYRPGVPLRRLEFLGSDVVEQDGVCSDYLNLIVRAGQERRVAEAFAGSLRAGEFGAWDECVLTAMDRDHPLTTAVVDALRKDFSRAELMDAGRSPFLALPPTWDAYLRTLPKKKRQSLTYAQRDFDSWAEGAWRVEVARTPTELERGMKILEDLHHQRWRTEGHGGAFASPRFRAFHGRFAPAALAEGQLLLTWITVRDVPVAALYALTAHGRAYFYQCGRVVDAPRKVRLGIVMVMQAIQQAQARGLNEFDFLAGDSQYKALFTAAARPLCHVRVARLGLPELAYRISRRTIDWARAVRTGLASVAGKLQRRKPIDNCSVTTGGVDAPEM